MLASYNIDYKNETPTKWAGDHEKLLYRRVKKCLYQQTSWLVDKTKLRWNGGMEIPRLGGKIGCGWVGAALRGCPLPETTQSPQFALVKTRQKCLDLPVAASYLVFKSRRMPSKPSKPHDEFFKATFGRLDIALDYLQNMLPAGLQQDLDLSKLERVNGSFVSPALQEYFSDVVYQSPLKIGKQSVVLSFIFEHKSKPEPRPHLQLLRYMLDAWTEQLHQNNKKLNPIIPILVYHGKQGWKKRDFDSYFGKKLPASILPFLPRFDYIFTHVTDMSDEQILELGTGLLINTFLMLKHIHDPDFIMQNAELIFINLTEPHSQQDFIVLVLAYFYKNSQLAEEKIHNFIQNLPKTLNKTAMSTYDMILEEGKKIGEIERKRLEEELEEARQQVNKVILYLYQIDQKTPEEIALIVSKDQTYVETVISNSEEENIADN